MSIAIRRTEVGMPEVLIGGIEYVPRAEIPELSDARLEQALKILTAYLYFDSSSRPMAMVLNLSLIHI